MPNSNDPPADGVEAPAIDLGPRGVPVDLAWLPFLGPLVVYMLAGMFAPEAVPQDVAPDHAEAAATRYADEYFRFTATRALAFAVALPLFLAWSLRMPRLRVSPLAIGVGVAGVLLWVGAHHLGLEARFVTLLGEDNQLVGLLGLGARESFNPVDAFGYGTTTFWLFLAARFLALAAIVPVIEELMLRGWLMRMVQAPDFWRVPFGTVTRAAVIAGTAFPMLYHPEKLASLIWFTLVTWLMVRTKNFWDCVAAHAVTNFLLGVWVVWTGAWELW